MGRKVGIDLGTTNTVVAIADGASPRVLRNKEGEELTLSVVGVPRRGNANDLLVGTPAYRNWKTMPRDTALSVKRLMGRGYEDDAVQTLKEKVLYEIIEPEDGTGQSLRVVLADQEYSPVEISARILAKVKADAEFQLDGDPVTHAVITVPAYFSEVQRKATRDAAKEAGLEVIQILDEPTAAAIAFGLERGVEDPRIVLVYDFGGGTFDISVLTWANSNFAPMNLEGDMWLGGDDLDEVIVDKIVANVQDEYDIDLRDGDHDKVLVEVKQEARRLKEALSAAESGDILITTPDFDIDFSITREEFELAIIDLVATYRACGCGQNNDVDSATCHACGASISQLPEQDGKAIALIRRALQNAHLTIDDVDYVLLAGNSTLVPLVRRSVDKLFGRKIKSVSHPKLVVAQGAAVVAAQVGDRLVCASWLPDKQRECGVMNERGATICAACGAVLGADGSAAGGAPIITVGSGTTNTPRRTPGESGRPSTRSNPTSCWRFCPSSERSPMRWSHKGKPSFGFPRGGRRVFPLTCRSGLMWMVRSRLRPVPRRASPCRCCTTRVRSSATQPTPW
ncbi:MAG: Hsp70 family protein [Proteobacteria bacterium]|nr:Hsp70 family protein [Pseudomonadota bacterium]